ncbi:peptidyl-alpha-hydroxyglycine alpha-amidating lyase family protein [Tautonia plasticadhaerens]|uniref:peptidylamidoglycolate lyase n=1 Tax=Tautonia plasticadhaerens TaxID=2527974 RepID=A0A518HAM4_9BACT|nr:peptidyl-alpha-hydroxyglycine alpha-amidating lyase family protein [Tautonia plasticadhaerens]QDV37806.1 Virginiamycin B lyase [Tautonia plasticadhaerens]
MTRRLSPLLLLLPLVAIPTAIAQKPPTSTGPAAVYPRVSLTPWFQVDPDWPQTPDGMPAAHVPGIAVGPDGNVYVAVRADPPIRVFTPEGEFVRAFAAGECSMVHHLKFDPEGNLWVADVGDHTLKKYDPESGERLQTLGTPDEKGCDESHFNMPTDIVVTEAGDHFVSDGYGNGRVVHFDKDGHYVKAWGELGVEPGQFSIAHAIALDSEGRLYVADRNNVRVQIFDQDGTLLDTWANVIVPWGLAVTADDEIWACGSSPMHWRLDDVTLGCPPKDQIFMKFDTDGRVLQQWSVPKGEDGHEHPGDCNWVHCIAADADGNLYVGDIIGQRAQKFVPFTSGEVAGPFAASPEE